MTRGAALDSNIAIDSTSCLNACGQAEDVDDEGVSLHLWLKETRLGVVDDSPRGSPCAVPERRPYLRGGSRKCG